MGTGSTTGRENSLSKLVIVSTRSKCPLCIVLPTYSLVLTVTSGNQYCIHLWWRWSALARRKQLPTLTRHVRAEQICSQDCPIAGSTLHRMHSVCSKWARCIQAARGSVTRKVEIWKGDFWLICGGARDLGLLGNGNQWKFWNTAVKWWKLILERFISSEQDDLERGIWASEAHYELQ